MALLCSINAAVLAADPPSTDVYGSYTAEGGAPVYSYAYNWGDMNIRYVDAGQPAWNPKTHAYDGETLDKAQWVYPDGSNVIVITNHSNAPIIASAVFTGTEERFKGGFVNNGAEIASAEGTAYDSAPSAELQFRMLDTAGGLTAADGTNKKLGTITLQVKAK